MPRPPPRRCRAGVGKPLANIVLEDLPDLNWVAMSQAALPPVIAGRFVVHGSHDRGRIPYGPRAILVDAGEAFGTAHHATTLGCLLAIDKLARAGHHAPRARPRLRLGRAGHRRGPRHARRRRSSPPIPIPSPSRWRAPTPTPTAPAASPPPAPLGLDHPWLRHAAPFDLIIANILAGPLRVLAGDVAKSVRRGGSVILSGILNPEAAAVIAAYAAHGFVVVQHRRIGEWTTLTLRKRRLSVSPSCHVRRGELPRPSQRA